MTRTVRPLAIWLLLWCGGLSAEPIRIGYYGPADPNHPIGGSIWQGFTLAIEEVRDEGGEVEIVQEWDENPWSGGARGVVRMAYEEHVVAILGSINGDATHLAEQVVAKALLPLVDPASTDRTVNAAFVPWMFSVMPDDRALMQPLVSGLPDGPFLLVTSTGHDFRMMAKEFLSLLGSRHPARHVEFRSPEGLAPKLSAVGVKTVVILAGPVESARLVRDLRTVAPGIVIYGSHTFGRRTFRDDAGEAAEGVRFPMPMGAAPAFERKFADRFGMAPDYAACHAYDATRLLIEAIQRAGADRNAIREALASLTSYAGVSGSITWDKLRRNSRRCRMATIRDGRIRMRD